LLTRAQEGDLWRFRRLLVRPLIAGIVCCGSGGGVVVVVALLLLLLLLFLLSCCRGVQMKKE
jgi:hypothetical protein